MLSRPDVMIFVAAARLALGTLLWQPERLQYWEKSAAGSIPTVVTVCATVVVVGAAVVVVGASVVAGALVVVGAAVVTGAAVVVVVVPPHDMTTSGRTSSKTRNEPMIQGRAFSIRDPLLTLANRGMIDNRWRLPPNP